MQSAAYTIEYFAKIKGQPGVWVASSERFATMEEAELSAIEQVRKERKADLTPIARRACVA